MYLFCINLDFSLFQHVSGKTLRVLREIFEDFEWLVYESLLFIVFLQYYDDLKFCILQRDLENEETEHDIWSNLTILH